MTIATTYFSTGNATTEERRKVEVSDILWHVGEPSDTPLMALVGGKIYKSGEDTPEEVKGVVKKELSEQVDYKVIEKDLLTRTVTVNGAVADTTTLTVTLDSNSACTVGDILTNKDSGEQMFVTAVDSGGANLTVRRNLGSTAYTIADDAVLHITGHASKQGGSKRSIRSVLAAPRTRYCQIFKRTFGITKTVAASQLETKVAALDEEQQQALVEHSRDIEFSFWGNPGADSALDASSNTVYFTRGIEAELASYKTDCQGALDADVFNSTVLEECFQYGPSTKSLFANAKLLSKINSFAEKKQITEPKKNDYGLNVQRYLSAHGTLDIIHCGAFDQYKSSSNGGYGIVLDLNRVAMKYMQGRDTYMQMDIQTPGDDVIEGQYMSEVGLSLRSLAHHRIIHNVG